MLRRTTRILTFLTLAGSASFAADRARIEVEVRRWDPSINGQIQVLEAGFGTEIDFATDLGLEADSFEDLRLTFYPSRRTKFRFSAVPLDFAGDSVVSRSITFAGQTFTVSTRVASQLTIDYFRAGFAWQFLASSDNRFRVGPLIEIKGFDGQAGLAAPDLELPESIPESFQAVFGSAGIAIDLEPSDRLHFFAEYTTLVGADEGDETDLEVGVRVHLWGALHGIAGYRSIEIQFDDDDDRINLDLDGAFFGASLRF